MSADAGALIPTDLTDAAIQKPPVGAGDPLVRPLPSDFHLVWQASRAGLVSVHEKKCYYLFFIIIHIIFMKIYAIFIKNFPFLLQGRENKSFDFVENIFSKNIE